jgi:dUTP pyrophosphatase
MSDAKNGLEVRMMRLDRGLELPAYAMPGDAGLDLRSAIDCTLAPLERRSVPCGIAVEIPEGHAGLVVPRSGLAERLGLSIVNSPGIIDSQYRGEVKVILVNLDKEKSLELRRGERIAQLVILAHPRINIVECDELSPTQRGEGGFGSSGTT